MLCLGVMLSMGVPPSVSEELFLRTYLGGCFCKNNTTFSKKCTEKTSVPVFIKIIINKSHIYDITRPRPREGLEFTKYKNYPNDDANKSVAYKSKSAYF